MPIYSEQSAGGVQEVIFDTKDNEGCEIQKPQMKKDEDKKQIIDLVVNIVFILYLHMNNNYNIVGFGMQRSKDDMLGILVKLIGVFTQSSELWVELVETSIQSPNVFSQLVDKWAQSAEGVQGERSVIQIMQGDYRCRVIGR